MIEPTYEVYHGNCFDRLREIPDKSVTLILTDPPYGHNQNNGDLQQYREAACVQETKKRKKKNLKWETINTARPIDGDSPEENDALIKGLFAEAARLLAPSGSCCCCCCCAGGGPDPQFARWSLWMDEVLSFDQQIIWDKGGLGMGWRYRRAIECVLVAHRKGGKLSWFDDTGAVPNIVRPGWRGIRRVLISDNTHPTEKPVELFELFIRLHTKPGDLIVDPFCGSGASGVAAKKLGRSWIGCDTDVRWIEMTKKRLAAITPPMPELLEAEYEECLYIVRRGHKRPAKKEERMLYDDVL